MAFFLTRQEAEEAEGALEAMGPKKGPMPEMIRAPKSRNLREILVDEWINMSPSDKQAQILGLFADPGVMMGMLKAKALGQLTQGTAKWLIGRAKELKKLDYGEAYMAQDIARAADTLKSAAKIHPDWYKNIEAIDLPSKPTWTGGGGYFDITRKGAPEASYFANETIDAMNRGIGKSPDPFIGVVRGTHPHPKWMEHELAHAAQFTEGFVPEDVLTKLLDTRAAVYNKYYRKNYPGFPWSVDPTELQALRLAGQEKGATGRKISTMYEPIQPKNAFIDELVDAWVEFEKLEPEIAKQFDPFK